MNTTMVLLARRIELGPVAQAQFYAESLGDKLAQNVITWITPAKTTYVLTKHEVNRRLTKLELNRQHVAWGSGFAGNLTCIQSTKASRRLGEELLDWLCKAADVLSIQPWSLNSEYCLPKDTSKSIASAAKMKVRLEARRSLTDFKLRSFDCFGTLVDYDCECSLHPCFGIPDPVIMTSWHLQYLLSRLLSTHLSTKTVP